MIVTAKYIKSLIQAAKDAGADRAEIQELQEELLEIESGKLLSNAGATFSYEKIESDGTKVINCPIFARG
jgi:sialic acid synthase SpsE